MTILEKIAALGFTNATDLGSKGGKTLVRVMTSRGWVYERFASVDDVVVWAMGHYP